MQAQKINYQKQLDSTLQAISNSGKTPHLVLHSCCAPCSSYCLEYLTKYFNITVFYYNPNIYPPSELELRAQEQERFVKEFSNVNAIDCITHLGDQDKFYEVVKDLQNEPEGGKRCQLCFNLRLEKTAQLAKELNADYFATTLTISPLKNAQVINQVGQALQHKHQVQYLASDFKKKEGYKRSTQLSNIYGIYRQNYCGCVFSMDKGIST